MNYSPFQWNLFTVFKLPSAFFSGVRVVEASDSKVLVKVRYNWFNTNPFKSMYWATQGMASELATGIVMFKAIDKANVKVSMLVTAQKGQFFKKAVGKIYFNCENNDKIQNAIDIAKKTGEGQIINLSSQGVDETNTIVSSFEYEWSIKVKSKK
ncbi:MAG: thioesterase [Flavicella sp.]